MTHKDRQLIKIPIIFEASQIWKMVNFIIFLFQNICLHFFLYKSDDNENKHYQFAYQQEIKTLLRAETYSLFLTIFFFFSFFVFHLSDTILYAN